VIVVADRKTLPKPRKPAFSPKRKTRILRAQRPTWSDAGSVPSIQRTKTMSRESFPGSLPLALSLIVTAGTLAVLSGCGADPSNETTASSSRYAPAGEGDNQSPSVASPKVVRDREPPASARVASGSQQQPANPSALEPPAAQKAPRKVSYELPQGGAPELLAYIEALNQALVELAQDGASLDAIRAEVNKNLDAQLSACEKILAMQPKLAEGAREEAVGAKTRALILKFQLQTPGAEEQLTTWIGTMEKDPDEAIRNLAAAARLMVPLTKLKTEEVQDTEPVLTALGQFLGSLEDFDASSFNYGVETIQTFQSLGRMDEMISSMRSVGSAFQASSNEQVVSAALELTQNAAQMLEFDGRMDEAQEVFASLEKKAATVDDPELKKKLENSVANFHKRTNLVGQEFTLENMIDLDGRPIDWSKYQGKVVLIDFWATWCKPCINEFYNIAEAYAAYKDEGFEVISVSVDDNLEDVKHFFSQDRLEWTIAIPADSQQRGLTNPLAVACGVEAIPFVLLVDQSGKVAAIQTHGPHLGPAVRKLLHITEDASAPPDSAAPTAAAPETSAPAPAAAPSAESEPEEPELDLPLQPAARDGAAFQAGGREYFVSFTEEEADSTDEAPANAAGEKGQDSKAVAAPPARNPYLADKDLSTFELVEFLQDMGDKPRVIQQRPGFAEAVAEAADRILADPQAKEKYQIIAALAKFRHLHERASFGDEPADAALAAFVEKMKDDPREKIAHEVKLLQLERRALEADKLDAGGREALLAELRKYFQEHREELEEKHLRIASAAVGVVNRLEDGDAREALFREFGALFATSGNKELAGYGRRLAKESAPSDLVGVNLELDGVTELGVTFDWQAYRGKVVVVDFWATWCGPCRRAMPVVKAFLEAHRGEGFDVVGVNLDEDREALAQFLNEQNIPWPNLAGEDGARLAEKYSVRIYPTFLLVDRDGKVLGVSHAFEDLQPQIEKLLKTP
jgi:thiol-disulfide isomerase/thioredoxin